MTSIELEKEKREIIEWVNQLTDDNAIAKLLLLKSNQQNTDWWDEISEEEKLAIEIGINDMNAGRVHPQETAQKLYEKWL